MANWKEALPLKIVNVLVFLFFFSTGLYSSLSPNGHHGGRDTAITPSSYVFYVWTLIDLCLLGMVIYQFFDGSKDVIHAIGWRFAVVGILNAIFLHVFVTRHFIVAFVFSLFVFSSVSHIYYSLRAHHANHSGLDTLFVHLPFSLWHAWSLVTIFISAFAAFQRHGAHANLVTKILAVLVLVFFAMTSVGYAFQTRKGDIAGALVIAWTLYGIFDHQHQALIRWFALGAFIVSALAVIKSLAFTLKKDGGISLSGRDEERAPLVG